MKLLVLLLMSPFFLVGLYDLIFYLPSSTLDVYPDLNGYYKYFFAFQILFYFILSFLFLFIFNQNEINTKYKIIEIENSRVGLGFWSYIMILTIFSLLFLYLFYSVFNDFNFVKLFTENGKFYANSKIGTAWVFFVFQFLLFLILYDIYKTKPKKFKIILFCICLFLLALTGGRSALISYFIFLFFIYTIVHNMVVSKILVLLMGILFVFIFIGNALLRGGENTTLLDYIKSDAFRLDFNNSYVLQDSIDYISSNDDYYLIASQDAMYSFVPRRFMPEKPVSTAETRLVYRDMLSDGRTTNITFGIYGNMVINFGFLGLILGFLCLLFSNYQYIKVCNRLSYKRPSDFLWLYFFMFFILVLRGGFFNMRIVLSLIVVSSVVIFYELFYRIKIKK